MRKILLAAAMLTLCSTSVFAAAGITNSKHDLSKSSAATLRAVNQTQICIYCHTPHNAFRNIPLWNRTAVTGNFKLYTSSTTLTSAARNSKLDQNSISIFCLSCHDGGTNIATNTVYKSATGDVALNGGVFRAEAIIGGGTQNLTNDHPIGFSYGDAVTGDASGLNTTGFVTAAFGGKNVFYKSTAVSVSDSMECSSCHAVHDNLHSPFLRTSNAGSALCLACHKK